MRTVSPPSTAVALLAFSPLAFIPGGFERFVIAKLLVVTIAIGLGSLAPARGRLPRPVVVIGAVALALLLVAACTSAAPLASVIGRYPRYEGLPVWLIYAGCAWLGARLLPDARTRRAFETALACASLVEAVVSVLQLMDLSPLPTGGVRRPGALVGNATDQGLLGVVMVAVLMAPALRTRRPLLLAGLVGALLAVAASGSRGGFVALAVVLLAHAVARPEFRRSVAIGAAFAALLVVVLPHTRDRLLATHTVRGRWLLWSETLHLVRDHLVFGVGPSGFYEAIRRYHDLTWAQRVGVSNPPDSPHLWLLQAAAAGGLPVLLCALAMTVVVGRLGLRAVGSEPSLVGPLAAGVGYSVGLLTHFTSAGTTPVVAFVLGGLVSSPVSSTTAARQLPTLVAVRLVAATGVLILATGGVGEVMLARAIQARASFDAVAKWRPWDPDLRVFAAQSLAGRAGQGDARDVVPAETWARKALRLVPSSVDARTALAVAFLREGRLGAARAELDRLAVAAPAEPTVFLERGIARFGQGDIRGSLADLGRAHALDPGNATVGRVKDEILSRVK